MVTSWKVSDAQIKFFAQGQQFVIGDYTDGGCGVAGVITMWASYSPADSIFFISGTTDGAYIKFKFRGPLSPGTFILDKPLIPVNDNSNVPVMHGGAFVVFGQESDTEHVWRTDSLHTGSLIITSIDSLSHVYNAIFNFIAIDTANNDSSTDTAQIESGVITKMLEDQ